MPGAGGTQRLTREAGKFHAVRLCHTGRMIDQSRLGCSCSLRVSWFIVSAGRCIDN